MPMSAAAIDAACKSQDCRKTGDDDQSDHPKPIDGEKRRKAQGVLRELREGVGHRVGFRWFMMRWLLRAG